MKQKTKKALAALAALTVLTAGTLLCGNAQPEIAKAETNGTQTSVEPRGFYTNVEIYFSVIGTTVAATAENTFTFFPSTVKVTVNLYSSETYTENVSEMTLESTASIADLNMGNSLQTTAEINGRVLYWRGEVCYNLDNKPQEKKYTDIYRLSANGTVI